MPRKRIGLIGWRLVGTCTAFVGCAVGAMAYQGTLEVAALLWLAATFGIAVLNVDCFPWGGDTLAGTFDAGIGGGIALGGGALALMLTGSDTAGFVATAAVAIPWRTAWTVPTLGAEATLRLVEEMVEQTWRAHPGFLLAVTRHDHPGTPAPVGFDTTSEPTTAGVQGYADCVQAFRTPFLLRVVFGPDAYQRPPYEDLSDYISPRLATVVDVGSLRELDTDTQLWSLPTSAHGRMAFEARVAQA
jgi:hypothetical protein